MIRVFSMILVGSLACCAFGQEASRNTVTLSAGGAGGGDGGPAINGNYEYRLFKYLAVEGGLSTMLPSYNSYQFEPVLTGFPLSTTTGDYVFRLNYQQNRVMMLPFGIKGILPLAHGRLELFMGAGGAYAWNSNFSRSNSWLEQGNIGARFAVDRNRRFWVGTTWRYFGNVGNLNNTVVTDRNWFTGTADIGFRFGH